MTTLPVVITFRGLALGEEIEAEVRERVAWLERFHSGIVGCRVVVDVPKRHQKGGSPFNVRVEVTVPGAPPIVVSHEPTAHGPLKDAAAPAHRKANDIEAIRRDVHVAVHQAFDAARRQLQDAVRERRGAVKTHMAG